MSPIVLTVPTMLFIVASWRYPFAEWPLWALLGAWVYSTIAAMVCWLIFLATVLHAHP